MVGRCRTPASWLEDFHDPDAGWGAGNGVARDARRTRIPSPRRSDLAEVGNRAEWADFFGPKWRLDGDETRLTPSGKGQRLRITPPLALFRTILALFRTILALNRTIGWLSKRQMLNGVEPHHHWCSSARSVGLDRTIGWGSTALILNRGRPRCLGRLSGWQGGR